MTNTTTKPTISSVIIVGGGAGGVSVARDIAKLGGASVAITVIDRQNYMDWALASPRMLAQPDDIEKHGYCMPLDKVCQHVAGKHGNIRFRQGAVSKISPKSVTLSDGTLIEADAIVVAIGGQYASGAPWKPLEDQTTKETRIAGFRRLHKQLAAAQSILVAGAGPTGVEVAGELKAAFPDCRIVMVGSLLPNSPTSIRIRMKAALEGMGVVVQEGRVDATAPDSDGNVTTREGGVIENITVVLNAAGFIFKGKELADDALLVDVNERGQFSCRPTLQLKSVDTVFCCGDALEVPQGFYADVKGLVHADETGKAVAKNVVQLLKEKPLVDFKWSSKPIQKPMMTALGPKIGVGFIGLPNFVENFMCRTVKCKDYYMGIKGSHYGKGKTW